MMNSSHQNPVLEAKNTFYKTLLKYLTNQVI